MGLQFRNGNYYYSQSKRVNGRVKTVYVGCGEDAVAAFLKDQQEQLAARLFRQQEQTQWQEEREAADTLDQAVDAVCDEAAVAFHTVMEAAGYHQHARGQWRKKRQEKQEDAQDGN